jgi:glucuronosyltransferase
LQFGSILSNGNSAFVEVTPKRLNMSVQNRYVVSHWVPQNDLLGHPKLKAFVTQGGYISISEAAYHGVPVVGVPLIPGQGEIVRYAADQGRGILLSKSVLTKGQGHRLKAALDKVLKEPSYRQEAHIRKPA